LNVQAKPIIPREEAARDVDDALTYYLNEHAPEAAHGFIDALEHAYQHISQFPGSGSPRYAHELNLPDIRHWSLGNYPYLVFYVEQTGHIDVWRILHSQRDIPEFLAE
jgi:toxin ParE1/3/4